MESDITNANTVDADSLTDTEPEAILDSIVEDVIGEGNNSDNITSETTETVLDNQNAGGSYKFITNPLNNKRVTLNGPIGRRILNNYLKFNF